MKTVTIRMKADDTAEVLLYDTIGSDFFGDGITAKAFREQVKGVKAKVMNLRINSPGGSVTEGAAILNALDQWPGRIEVDVDGLAASAASVVMMAGDLVRVASNALVMIHDPVAMAVGPAEELRRTAELLDKVKGQIIEAYLRRAKMTRAEVSAAMAAETWYTGQEAVAAGLADEAGEPVALANAAGHAELLAKWGCRKAPALLSALAAAERAAREETDRRREELRRLFGA